MLYFILKAEKPDNPCKKLYKMDEHNLENKETYPYEYVIKNGIPYEEYLVMPQDEKDVRFPYGSVTFSGLTVAVTFENHQAVLENDRILTVGLMRREGLEVNHELRERFPNSFFWQSCYDDSISGVDPITQSVIYDCMRFGQLKIMFCEWTYPDYGDTLNGTRDIIKWAKDYLTPDKLDGKVPPTLILPNGKDFSLYWKDIFPRPDYKA